MSCRLVNIYWHFEGILNPLLQSQAVYPCEDARPWRRFYVITSCTIRQSTLPKIPDDFNLTASFSSVKTLWRRSVGLHALTLQSLMMHVYTTYFQIHTSLILSATFMLMFDTAVQLNNDHCFYKSAVWQRILWFFHLALYYNYTI